MLECIHMIQEVLVVECNLMESVLQDVYEVEDVEYASVFSILFSVKCIMNR